MLFSNSNVGNKEESTIFRSQGGHEHNHSWYNIQNDRKINLPISKQQ